MEEKRSCNNSLQNVLVLSAKGILSLCFCNLEEISSSNSTESLFLFVLFNKLRFYSFSWEEFILALSRISYFFRFVECFLWWICEAGKRLEWRLLVDDGWWLMVAVEEGAR